MASLTIRKLDEAIKTYLRLRSAQNGRSVEEEVRVILRQTIEGVPFEFPAARSAAPPPAEASSRTPIQHAGTDHARVTLIIGGGIAAYKSLDLIRRFKERNIRVRCVLTKAAQQFVTPLSASALSHERVYTDLFDPESEFDAGHIRLARDCDLIVVAPAPAGSAPWPRAGWRWRGRRHGRLPSSPSGPRSPAPPRSGRSRAPAEYGRRRTRSRRRTGQCKRAHARAPRPKAA